MLPGANFFFVKVEEIDPYQLFVSVVIFVIARLGYRVFELSKGACSVREVSLMSH